MSYSFYYSDSTASSLEIALKLSECAFRDGVLSGFSLAMKDDEYSFISAMVDAEKEDGICPNLIEGDL